jgi:hypothetical protein
MADKVTVIPPRDPWPFSTIAMEDLETLVADGLLRPHFDGLQPEWMAPSSEADPTPPSGYVLSFIPFYERGFGVPASRFMRALLHHYGVELHNLNPTLSRKQPSLRRFARVFWGLTITGTCGPIFFPRSFSPRRRRRRRSVWRCGPVAAPSS